MAYRLGNYIVSGSLDNRRRNRTVGTLSLWASDGPGPGAVRFELTGDCNPDFRGKKIRFWCRQDPWKCTPVDPVLFSKFQWLQIGATGTMTASGWVRSMPCDVGEYLRRKELGEPPPTPWVRRLYLEWYGQNGRVVVEMADPLVEQRPDKDEVDGRRLAPDEIWVPLPNLAVMPDAALRNGPPAGLGITRISRDEGAAHIEHWSKVAGKSPEWDEEDCCETMENGFEDNDAINWREESETGWEEEYEEDPCVEEMERMDACLEETGTPLCDLLKDMGKPPAADTLDDGAVEAQLKSIIGQLALFNIAFDICEHFTPREAYRILTEKILPNECGHPTLAGTGWITHFATHEFCRECDVGLEDDGRDEQDTTTGGSQDDVPF